MEQQLIQYLSPEGSFDPSKMADISDAEKMAMYRAMWLTRAWGEKAFSLQRQGRLGTFPSTRGQEASNIGLAMALGKDDWFVPAFRETGALLHLGISPKNQFHFWGGEERGGHIAEPLRVLPIQVIVGAHLCHAVGIAMAAKIKKEKVVAISCSGDGSTSEGDFHESLNMAAVFKAPVVFVIQNNQWAISIPFAKQTATATIAEKAAAYGLPGYRVDGNDVFAVYKTVKECIETARAENRPALVELVTYRLDDHTTADDATKYRTNDEVEVWRAKDPFTRLQGYLRSVGLLDDAKDAAIQEDVRGIIEQAAQEYLAASPTNPETIFDHMYAEMPWNLIEQREEFRAYLPHHKGGH